MTHRDAWRQCCDEIGVPPLLLWKVLPGYDRVTGLLAMAEQVAFNAEEFLEWLNTVKPAGDGGRTENPYTAEGRTQIMLDFYHDLKQRWCAVSLGGWGLRRSSTRRDASPSAATILWRDSERKTPRKPLNLLSSALILGVGDVFSGVLPLCREGTQFTTSGFLYVLSSSRSPILMTWRHHRR